MSSSVSYISKNKTIGEKVPRPNKKPLDFNVPDVTPSTPLGTGVKPEIGTERIVDYNTNAAVFNGMPLSHIVSKMNESVFIPNSSDTVQKSFIKTSDYYNRFKTANPNTSLQKGFAHVFFVRPSCNLLKNGTIRDGLKANEIFHYTWRHSPSILKELVSEGGQKHDFMLTTSNAASSFSLSDEYINSDSYGKTYTGYKISYGKNNIESKTAGEFTVTFTDDRNLHIYQLHRIWVEYINGVYRGEIAPEKSSIMNKILDYTGACYYILTAEDGETIIFWSKYYGVFPTTIPSSQYSWGAGNIINNPQIDITYKFSFKEDFNPYSILEFNYNSRVDSHGAGYVPVYDSTADHVGQTWVGAPFIELVKNSSSSEAYVYKLRFRS